MEERDYKLEENQEFQLIQEFQQIMQELYTKPLEDLSKEDFYKWKRSLSRLSKEMKIINKDKYASFISIALEICYLIERIFDILMVRLIKNENLSIMEYIQEMDQLRTNLSFVINDYVKLFLELECIIKLPKSLFSYTKKLEEIFKKLDVARNLQDKIKDYFCLMPKGSKVFKNVEKPIYKIDSFFRNVDKIRKDHKFANAEIKLKKITELYQFTFQNIKEGDLITESIQQIQDLFMNDMIKYAGIRNSIKKLIPKECLIVENKSESINLLNDLKSPIVLNDEKEVKKIKKDKKIHLSFFKVSILNNEKLIFYQFTHFFATFNKISIFQIQLYDLEECRKHLSLFDKALKKCKQTTFIEEAKADLKKVEDLLALLFKHCSKSRSNGPLLKGEISNSILEYNIKQDLLTLYSIFNKYDQLKNEKERILKEKSFLMKKKYNVAISFFSAFLVSLFLTNNGYCVKNHDLKNKNEIQTGEPTFKKDFFDEKKMEQDICFKRELYEKKKDLLVVLQKMNKDLMDLKMRQELEQKVYEDSFSNLSLEEENFFLK